MTGFEIVAAVPAALTDNPSDAHTAIRAELLPYFTLPFYRAMLEGSGLRGRDRGVRRGAG